MNSTWTACERLQASNAFQNYNNLIIVSEGVCVIFFIALKVPVYEPGPLNTRKDFCQDACILQIHNSILKVDYVYLWDKMKGRP